MDIAAAKLPAALDPAKFRDPFVTAKGEKRAAVALRRLDTLWFNTGTLCNLTCRNCYIESSPTNDRLAYLTAAEVREYLDEIARERFPTREIGFTGGEPFMNPDIIRMLEDALGRGFHGLVLTNAMRPMMRLQAPLVGLRARFGAHLAIRVSVDHYARALHDSMRGAGSYDTTLAGLEWLAREGFALRVAGRTCWAESEEKLRAGFARLFADRAIGIDAFDPEALVLFPEMDPTLDVPEITASCWGILNKRPDDVMCATSRMIVKRKGEDRPVVVACTLVPYDERFEMGERLTEATGPVQLNHPHCARFCVLGGGNCSRPAADGA